MRLVRSSSFRVIDERSTSGRNVIRQAPGLLALLAAVTLSVPVSSRDKADSTSIDAELEALFRELETQTFTDDPFDEGGRVPDLVVLSTCDTRGETAPCG